MIAISFKFKARPNARNISTQHLTKFLNRVVRCCEGHPKLLQQKFDHFQTWSNTIQHIATCCYRLAKRVQHFARNNVAGCCVEKLHALEFRKNLKTFYNNVVHFMCLFRQTAFVSSAMQSSFSQQPRDMMGKPFFLVLISPCFALSC